MPASDVLLILLALSSAIAATKALLFGPDFVWALRHGRAIRNHLDHADDPAEAMRNIERHGFESCAVCRAKANSHPSAAHLGGGGRRAERNIGKSRDHAARRGDALYDAAPSAQIDVSSPRRPRISSAAAGLGNRWGVLRTPCVVGLQYVMLTGYILVTGSGYDNGEELSGLASAICVFGGITLAVLAFLTLSAAPILRFAFGRYDIHHSDLASVMGDGGQRRDTSFAFALYFLALIVVSLVAFAGLYASLYATSRAFDFTLHSSPITWLSLSAGTASGAGSNGVMPANTAGETAVLAQLLTGPLVLFWLITLLVTTRPADTPKSTQLPEPDPSAAPSSAPPTEPHRADLTIVLPSYNESAALPITLERLAGACRTRELSWETLVVDDGSTDSTADLDWDFFRREYAAVRLQLRPRRGKGAAVREGLRHARGSYWLITDADLPIVPSELMRCVELAMTEKHEILIGRRGRATSKMKPSMGRPFASSIVRGLSLWLLGSTPSDPSCPLTILKASSGQLCAEETVADGYLINWEMILVLRRSAVPITEELVLWNDLRVSAWKKLRMYGLIRIMRDVDAIRAVARDRSRRTARRR